MITVLAFLMSGIALGIVVWSTFFRKSNTVERTELLEKKVKYLQDSAALVIDGDGEFSDAIIMHKGKVIYTKLKNEEQ